MGRVAPLQPTTMASPWRRRQPCLLEGAGRHVAVIRRFAAGSAFLETDARPPLGERVMIHHPEAGRVDGLVVSHAVDGIGVAPADRAAGIAFALAALAGDCSKSD